MDPSEPAPSSTGRTGPAAGGPASVRLFEKVYPTADFPAFLPAVRRFLADAGAPPGGLEAAVIAVAGPVADGRCLMTNLGWQMDEAALRADLGVPSRLLNDFEAVGYGVQAVEPGQLLPINGGARKERAPCVCVGAGTGLGEAIMIWDDASGGYKVVPTEGGHSDAPARGWKQASLVEHVARAEGFCELEHLLSGPGLVRIYEFLRTDPAAGRGASPLAAPAISRAALDGSSPLAREAVDLFLAMLGAEAGNLALKALARGGVYIAGGIAPKLVPRILESGALLEGFLHRASRFAPLLATLPLLLVLDEGVGLLGSRELAVRFVREQRRKEAAAAAAKP